MCGGLRACTLTAGRLASTPGPINKKGKRPHHFKVLCYPSWGGPAGSSFQKEGQSCEGGDSGPGEDLSPPGSEFLSPPRPDWGRHSHTTPETDLNRQLCVCSSFSRVWTFCNPKDCSLHQLLCPWDSRQNTEWLAMPFSRESWGSHITGGVQRRRLRL